jgi:hypothetical protein
LGVSAWEGRPVLIVLVSSSNRAVSPSVIERPEVLLLTLDRVAPYVGWRRLFEDEDDDEDEDD